MHVLLFISKIVSVKDYGAFVQLENTDKQGLLHRSAISNHPVENVSDVLEVGETVFVKIISDKVVLVEKKQRSDYQRENSDMD